MLGTIAPDFALPGVDGRVYRLSDFQSAKVLVVAFICNHCPYVIAIQGRMNRLAAEYGAKGVQWVGINSNDSERYPEDGFEQMKARAREQGYVFPYLRDETQEVARVYGAVCTPEFYVYLARGNQWLLQYQGRVDDSWKDESAVTRQELREALDRALAGDTPVVDQKPAIGCSIKWKLI
jgi:peroxiredoxin